MWDWEFSHCGNPRHSPQSALSLSFPFSQPFPQLGLVCSLAVGPFRQPHWHSPLPCLRFSPLARVTGLVGLVDCFFNSLVVRVPWSLIFWHFWLFIDFRLVVILLLVVWGSEGFLPMPPSWPERPHFSLNQRKTYIGNPGKLILVLFSQGQYIKSQGL